MRLVAIDTAANGPAGAKMPNGRASGADQLYNEMKFRRRKMPRIWCVPNSLRANSWPRQWAARRAGRAMPAAGWRITCCNARRLNERSCFCAGAPLIDARSNGPASTPAIRVLLSLADVQMARSRYYRNRSVLRDALQRQQNACRTIRICWLSITSWLRYSFSRPLCQIRQPAAAGWRHLNRAGCQRPAG